MFEASAGGSRPAPQWLAALDRRSGGFAPDRRFANRAAAAVPCEKAEQERLAAADIQRALDDAFAAGLAQAEAEAERRLAAERAGHERLRLAFARLDQAMQQTLADRLSQTVAVLCETALAPLGIDAAALQRRCTSAAAMLGEAQERLELHLHPDDIISLDADFAAGWKIVPRPEFERGTLRIEGDEAGVTDGPAEWRAALQAALAC